MFLLGFTGGSLGYLLCRYMSAWQNPMDEFWKLANISVALVYINRFSDQHAIHAYGVSKSRSVHLLQARSVVPRPNLPSALTLGSGCKK